MLEDPIIQNALTSKANYLDLERQKEEALKKDPKLYNDINYQDALDQGGFKSYMNGETQKLGQMRLNPYTDVHKELNERLSKWAKDHGYEKTVDVETGDYFFKTTKGERLSENKIKTFLRANLDSSMAQQMQINARQSIGKLPDAEYQSYAAENLKNNVNKYEKELNRQEALKTVAKGDDLKVIEENINGLREYIIDGKNKLKDGNFSKGLQYDLYNNKLFDNFADSYARDMVTDITFSDEPLKVKKHALELEKFNFDKLYKQKDLELKERQVELKEFELDGKNSEGNSLSAGTVIPEFSDQEDEGKLDYELIENNFKETEDNLRRVLEKNDPAYQRLKTDEDRSNHINYIMSLSKGTYDPTNTSMSPEVIAAADRHKNNYNVYSKSVSKIKSTLDSVVVDGYDDKIGAKGINLNNLAITMPETVKAIKTNKKFNELDKVTQDKIRYERAVNQLQFDSGLSRDDRKNISQYAARIASKNSDNKEFNKFVESTGDKDYISAWETTKALGSTIAGEVGNSISQKVSFLKYGFNSLFGNKGDAQEDLLKDVKGLAETQQEVERSRKKYQKGLYDRFAPTSDTNITEIGVTSDTKSGKSPNTQLKKNMNGLSQYLKDESKKLLPNVEQKVRVHFSTDNKAQVETARILAQTINSQAAKNSEIPMANLTKNDYAIVFNRPSNTYDVSYIVKDSESVNTVRIDAALMPPIIRNNVNEVKNNWQTDPKNPYASLPRFSFKTPISNDQKENIEYSFLNNFKSDDLQFNQAVLPQLSQTAEEVVENIKAVRPSITKDKIDDIGNFLTTTKIEMRPRANNGRFFLYPVEIRDGKEIGMSKPIMEIDHTLDSESLMRLQAQAILAYRQGKIDAILIRQ